MIKHLMFSKQYEEALLSGKKRVTIRLLRPPLPKPGTLVYVHCGGKIIGRARILGVSIKRVKELSDDEAREEGLPDREALIRSLKSHYPNLKPTTKVVVIRFDFVESYEEPLTPMEVSWGGEIDPVEVAKLALEKLELSGRERAILGLVVREGSIRKAALRLGGLHKRPIIRAALREAAERLREKGYLCEREKSSR